MSKLARYRRKVYRHRVVREWPFAEIKRRVKKASKKVNVSTFALYWKYIQKSDPTVSISEWRERMAVRRKDMKLIGNKIVDTTDNMYPDQTQGKRVLTPRPQRIGIPIIKVAKVV